MTAAREQREARTRQQAGPEGHRHPVLPRHPRPAMDELRQPQVSGKRIAALIGQDVGLAAVVVRSANSPYFGSGRRIASIDDAIRMLGFGMLANLVRALLRSNIADPGAALERFWDSSRCTAQASAMLAAAPASRARRPPTPSASSTTAASPAGQALPRIQAHPGHGQPGHRALVHRCRGRGARHQPRHHRLGLLARSWGLTDAVTGILCHHDYSVFSPRLRPGGRGANPDRAQPGGRVRRRHHRTRRDAEWDKGRGGGALPGLRADRASTTSPTTCSTRSTARARTSCLTPRARAGPGRCPPLTPAPSLATPSSSHLTPAGPKLICTFGIAAAAFGGNDHALAEFRMRHRLADAQGRRAAWRRPGAARAARGVLLTADLAEGLKRPPPILPLTPPAAERSWGRVSHLVSPAGISSRKRERRL